MKENRILLWFDVEDFITPQSDDALAQLLEMMNSLGIKSTLKLVTEKARVLRQRGREDIFRLMARHEIGYHTEKHSVHPVTTEYLDGMGFAAGASAFESREKNAFLELQELTGQRLTTYGQPGASWASQTYPALRKWGVPTYLDWHDVIDMDGKAYWYGGLLNWINLWATPRVELKYDDLEAAKRRFDQIVTGERDYQLISIYYHPCEFACEEFWDAVNFSNGKNPADGKLQPAQTCSAETMRRRVETLKAFLEYTLTYDNTTYLTASETLALEKSRQKALAAEKLREICAAVRGEVNYYSDQAEITLSASELLVLMGKYIGNQHLTGDVYYGPEQDAVSEIHSAVTMSQLGKAVLEQYETVLGYPQLPVVYRIGDNKISPADAFVTLADAIASGVQPEEQIAIRKGTLICANHVKEDAEWGRNWPIFAKDLKVEHTLETARLQTWTLKPALY